MLSKKRLLLAMVLSPLVPLDFYFLAMLILITSFVPPGQTGHTATLIRGVLRMAPHSYILSISAGALVAFVLCKIGKLTVRNILLCAFACGFLIGMAFELLISWPQAQQAITATGLKVGLTTGAISGLAGLLVAWSFVFICDYTFTGLAVRWSCVASILIVVDFGWVGWLGWQVVELRRFEQNLSKVTMGMPEDDVVGVFAEPGDASVPCRYHIKPPIECVTTLEFSGPFGRHTFYFLDAYRRVIGGTVPPNPQQERTE